MKNLEVNQVIGEANKVSGGHYLSWDCPDTNKEMWAQGEFYYNTKTEKIEHDVYDENDNLLYKVVASI